MLRDQVRMSVKHQKVHKNVQEFWLSLAQDGDIQQYIYDSVKTRALQSDKAAFDVIVKCHQLATSAEFMMIDTTDLDKNFTKSDGSHDVEKYLAYLGEIVQRMATAPMLPFKMVENIVKLSIEYQNACLKYEMAKKSGKIDGGSELDLKQLEAKIGIYTNFLENSQGASQDSGTKRKRKEIA